eukprot:scaffold9782_cov225-Isochrysis_galbana.AAC.1
MITRPRDTLVLARSLPRPSAIRPTPSLHPHPRSASSACHASRSCAVPRWGLRLRAGATALARHARTRALRRPAPARDAGLWWLAV